MYIISFNLFSLSKSSNIAKPSEFLKRSCKDFRAFVSNIGLKQKTVAFKLPRHLQPWSASVCQLYDWTNGSGVTQLLCLNELRMVLPTIGIIHWLGRSTYYDSGKRSLAQELDIVSQANTLQNVICSQTHSVFKSTNLRLRSTCLSNSAWKASPSALRSKFYCETQTWESRFLHKNLKRKDGLESHCYQIGNVEPILSDCDRSLPGISRWQAFLPTQKGQSHEKWTVDRDASIVEPENANGLRPFGTIEVPMKRDTVISSIQTNLDRGLTDIEGRLRNSDKDTSDYKSLPRVGCGWKGELWRRCLSTGKITSRRPPTICADRITKAPNYAICTRKLLRQIVLLWYFLSSMKGARPKSLYIIHADPEPLLGWRLKRISTCGTVEFWKPPQSFSAEDTIHWVEMTVGIVKSALAFDLEDELTLKPPAILTSIWAACPLIIFFLAWKTMIPWRLKLVATYSPLVLNEMKLGTLPVEKEEFFKPPETPTGSQPQSGRN